VDTADTGTGNTGNHELKRSHRRPRCRNPQCQSGDYAADADGLCQECKEARAQTPPDNSKEE